MAQCSKFTLASYPIDSRTLTELYLPPLVCIRHLQTGRYYAYTYTHAKGYICVSIGILYMCTTC